ncbi:MAG: Gfo/Idh/MocA family oxidoreductase [Planctomycetaceae bacterium]
MNSVRPGTSSGISRRRFLAAAAAAPLAISSTLMAARRPALERISVGVIGLGSRGFNLLDDFLKLGSCQVVALCDVDDFHHRDRPWGKSPAFGRKPGLAKVTQAYSKQKSGTAARGIAVHSDFRQLIARDDIDAVVIATPDHWHAACTLEAVRAGKDVYCEKPVTHLFAEGRQVIREVAKHQTVFQTGSQQRSDPIFHRIVELARNGVLGQIQSVEIGLPEGYDKPMGSTEIVQPRTDLDYDFWCGPAPVLPLMQARHHRWWRGHRAYGGGVLMDWIGHHNDIAHWALGMERSGPISVEAVDWTFPDTEVYNTPHHYTIRCRFANDVLTSISSRHLQGLKVIGSEGWVHADRGGLKASDQRWLAPEFRPGDFHIEAPSSHAADFLANVVSRGECIAPAEVAHRSITPGHLAYVSWQLKKPLEWNPETQQIINNPEADSLLNQVDYREPWQLVRTGR